MRGLFDFELFSHSRLENNVWKETCRALRNGSWLHNSERLRDERASWIRMMLMSLVPMLLMMMAIAITNLSHYQRFKAFTLQVFCMLTINGIAVALHSNGCFIEMSQFYRQILFQNIHTTILYTFSPHKWFPSQHSLSVVVVVFFSLVFFTWQSQYLHTDIYVWI